MSSSSSISDKELHRLLLLSDFDLDYSNLDDYLKDLSLLAANIAGTQVCLINLLDHSTQWSISTHNLGIKQMPREDSVCQQTILEEDHFEVKDLSKDERFKSKNYVKEDPLLKYYLGVPLKTEEGLNIGALCVMDKEVKELSAQQIQSLQLLAKQVIFRLKALKEIDELKNKLVGVSERYRKVAHDIRGPIGGIMGLAEMVCMKGMRNELHLVLEDMNLIQKSCESLLEVSKDILENGPKDFLEIESKYLNPSRQFNLHTLKEKVQDMFLPQAKCKDIHFDIEISDKFQKIQFSKSKLLQILGNLVSNAIKFTPNSGIVKVTLELKLFGDSNSGLLELKVEDSGVGLTEKSFYAIHEGSSVSLKGTEGESGFGYGLVFTQALINEMKGKLHISDTPLGGACFLAIVPVITQKRSVIDFSA
jgi:signal transduction histidine kinase